METKLKVRMNGTGRTAAQGPVDELGRSARSAIVRAAARLGHDPMELARRCEDGALADVVFELRAGRHALSPTDRERVEDLLREFGMLPDFG